MNAIRILALVISFALVAGCGGKDDVSEPVRTLQRALPADPETLDVQVARSTQAADVQRDIGEGLFTYSTDNEVVPAAAERFEMSEDGLTYTFYLREALRWSNGDPVTAEHFVAGMRRLVDPATAAFNAGMLIDLENAEGIISGDIPVSMLGVEAVDERTLVLRLVRPTAYLTGILTHPSTFPVHTPSLTEHGDDHAKPGRLVSNGAYRLDAWIPGSLIALKRNEHYWNNEATAIDAVNWHVIVQASAELNRYRAGELDITSTVPSDSFAQVRDEFGDQLHVGPFLAVYYLGFNLTKPPFEDNRALRRALSMAIDREGLTDKVTARGETPAYSWVPPGISGYEPVEMGFAALGKEERDQLARRLYKEAGYSEDNPLEIEVRYNTSDTNRRIIVAVQSMWREVLGFEATLVNEEFQVLMDNMRAAEITQVFRSSWVGDYTDPHTFLYVLQSDNAQNMPRYRNADFDDFMARAGAQTDPKQRKLLLEEAERIMLADYPVIPLYFFVTRHLVHPDVEGWGDNPLDYHYSQHLSFKAAE
ncbi:MAG: peptide ABC transporter substrate-binding protein [Woeseiaceae bacterium]|nr:peptide ABC transporter substrate-binding protein [Woeseiaceae bacterium]